MQTEQQILIHLSEPTEQGRLYYSRDPEVEANIVFIKSNIQRQQAFSINVGCLLILSIDKNHLLKSVEVIIPQRAWVAETPPTLVSEYSTPADITFPNFAEKNFNIDAPVKARTDQQKSYVRVSIGSLSEDCSWVALSPSCFALVKDSNLCGFYIRLTE